MVKAQGTFAERWVENMATQHALIIDDNRANIDVLILLLTEEGISYTAIQSPRLMDNVLAEVGHCDVVFLDLEIPNHDGFEILKRLRAYPEFADVPIVAYTVHTSEIDVARRAGFHSFLGKPLNAQRFSQQLARILRGESVWEI